MAMLGLVIVLVFLFGTLAGQGIHWLLHQRWTGPLHRAHLTHHLKKYPPDDMIGPPPYRGSGLDNSNLYFVPPISVLVIAAVFAMRQYGTWWAVQVIVIVESIAVGFLHSYVHDAFHVVGHWMEKVPRFARLRELHLIHHVNMRRNLGIFWFGWDRLFGTYRKKGAS